MNTNIILHVKHSQLALGLIGLNEINKSNEKKATYIFFLFVLIKKKYLLLYISYTKISVHEADLPNQGLRL